MMKHISITKENDRSGHQSDSGARFGSETTKYTIGTQAAPHKRVNAVGAYWGTGEDVKVGDRFLPASLYGLDLEPYRCDAVLSNGLIAFISFRVDPPKACVIDPTKCIPLNDQ